MQQPQLTDQQKKAVAECEKAIVDQLKKYDCHIEAIATLTGQGTQFTVVVVPNIPAPAPEPSQDLKVA